MYRLADPPRNAIEQAVRLLQSLLVRTVPGIADAGAVEWHGNFVLVLWTISVL